MPTNRHNNERRIHVAALQVGVRATLEKNFTDDGMPMQARQRERACSTHDGGLSQSPVWGHFTWTVDGG